MNEKFPVYEHQYVNIVINLSMYISSQLKNTIVVSEKWHLYVYIFIQISITAKYMTTTQTSAIFHCS